MTTYKKGTAWAVSGEAFVSREVDVLFDEKGKIALYSEKNDEEYVTPYDDEKFFDSKEAAEKEVKESIPTNSEQVKAYLKSICLENEFEKLRDWLPLSIISKFNKAREKTLFCSYSEMNQIREALRGNINIDDYSFRVTEVSYVKRENVGLKVILRDGTAIRATEDNDIFILESIFGTKG